MKILRNALLAIVAVIVIVKLGATFHRADRTTTHPAQTASVSAEDPCVPAAPPATGCAPAAPAAPVTPQDMSLTSVVAASQQQLGATLTKAEADMRQPAGKVKQNGMLLIHNGSDFATLMVTVYRLEESRRSAVKRDVIAPVASQMYSLEPGSYLATFNVANGTAAISEDRFNIASGEEYTINFHMKEKQ